jgi:biotin synthase
MSAVAQEMTVSGMAVRSEPRSDWQHDEVAALFELPLNDLLFAAQWVHRQHFDPNAVQVSTLLSIKTGRCPEDCAYCPQSVRFDTGLEFQDLMPLEEVEAAARKAREAGATRFCMGAAYRRPKDRDLDHIVKMIDAVNGLGMESCLTLGMLTQAQADRLAEAGLDFYNHNVDTSESYYREIISTRTYADRLETLERVRNAGIKVCCGGIVGMGESRRDRIEFLRTLATLPVHPESVPINQLVRVPGTPLAEGEDLDAIEFLRTIAVARIVMPRSQVRLSAGRTEFSDEMQAMCYFAGANSIFYGDKLLTTDNPGANEDLELFARLGLEPEPAAERAAT